jgi:plastocyanin domain-containing protein
MLNGTGTAVISGNIYWDGLTKAPLNTPAANVEIVLLNSDGTPIAYTFTNKEGYFEFEKLMYGDYTIHAEMPGKATEIAVVNLSENASNAGINFVMNKEAITITGISNSESSKITAGNPYPNPVSENLNIDYNSAKSQNAEVEIIDMQGRKIKTKTIGLRESKNSIRISTGDLVKGMYLIRIKTPGLEPVTRKFVK